MKKLTHVDARGKARMVEVGPKPETERVAIASGEVRMAPATVRLIRADQAPKGDVLAVARLAGIQAVKHTHTLIPLCHPLRISGVEVDITLTKGGARITATVSAVDRTGVEMEALTAVSVAALTLYDMVKAVDRGMVIGPIQLDEKRGGRSGRWVR
ncbi:MAG TPA: cyclic pyranopterin monophosphate synthase MoaC [Kofleriaceae bacterium]|nr:cyclic pyranopterin monophosphate synthase MoaC [Kofleriaceae bacterium]